MANSSRLSKILSGGLVAVFALSAAPGFDGIAHLVAAPGFEICRASQGAKNVKSLLIASGNPNNGVGGGVGGGRDCNRSGFSDETNPGLTVPGSPGQGQGPGCVWKHRIEQPGWRRHGRRRRLRGQPVRH